MSTVTGTNLTIYEYWIANEARIIGSDGCSFGFGAFKTCCLEHDLAYYYGRDPVDAHRHWRKGYPNGWIPAAPISREFADKRLLCCMQSYSRLGWWSPMAWWRYWVVRRYGGAIWSNHRRNRNWRGLKSPQ